MNVRLTQSQGRIVGGALTAWAGLFLAVAVLGAIWLLGQFLLFFSGVFLPLAVAAIVALVIKPYYDFVFQRTGRRALLSIALVYASVVIPSAAFIWFFGALCWTQLSGLTVQAFALAQEGWAVLKARGPDWLNQARMHRLDSIFQDVLESRPDWLSVVMRGFVATSVSAGIGLFHFVAGLLGWVIFPIYLGFFLVRPGLGEGAVEKAFPFLPLQTRVDMDYLGREFVNILVSFFRGQLIVALLQGLLYAVGFSIIGLTYGFVLGLMLGFLNIVPYLGSMVGLAIALPLGLFQDGGGWVLVAWVLVVFTAVQTLEGYVLTPRIMGNRTGLHPLVIIVAIFFWGTAFGGIWGMILAIPLTAFAVVCWRWVTARMRRAGGDKAEAEVIDE